MGIELTLGTTLSDAPIFWSDADNPHISVTGQSGSGKSYFLKGILEQAARTGAHCIIFDYTSDFREYAPSENIPYRYIDTGSPEFSLNPLAGSIDHEIIAQRLLSAVHAAFRLGSKGSLTLRQATLTCLKTFENPNLRLLAVFMDEQKKTPGLSAALEPVELLSSILHCENEFLSLDLDAPGLTTLGFEKFEDVRLRSTLIELILSAIWSTWTSQSQHTHPLILLLDESQNLNWTPSGMPIRILREGRKHQLAGWFATQWISKPEAEAALGQAALQAHFRPHDSHILSLAKQLGQGNREQVAQWQKVICSLRRGQFLMQRPDGKALIVRVPSREQAPQKASFF